MLSSQVRRVLDAGRRRLHAPQGLTRLPSITNSIISDLFVWRQDHGWTTNFELLSLASLLDPGDSRLNHEIKFVIFDAQGQVVADKTLHSKSAVRQTLRLKDHVPTCAGDFGTFACFHLGVDPSLTSAGTFLTERGYSSYGRGAEVPRNFVHGNLDAASWSASGLELLGTQGRMASRYRLQVVIEPDLLFELAVVNPTNHPITIDIEQDGRDGRQVSSVELEPKGVCIQPVGHGRKFDTLVSLRSKLPMARPIVFVSSEDSFDVFHG